MGSRSLRNTSLVFKRGFDDAFVVNKPLTAEQFAPANEGTVLLMSFILDSSKGNSSIMARAITGHRNGSDAWSKTLDDYSDLLVPTK